MFEGISGTILISLTAIFFLALFAVNYYYQRKSQKFVDNMLIDIPEEHNKQIKANAYRYLIGRCIWGLLFLSGFIFNFRAVIAQGFQWLTLFVLSLGIGCIVWGVFGFRSEMKKIKDFR